MIVRTRGFTLIEVLVALALMALVATLAWRATASLVDGESRLAAESQRWRTLDRVLARFEADLRQAQPRPVRVGGRLEAAWIAAVESHGSSALVISRAGGEFDVEPGAAGQRIAYRVRDETLELLYWPALDRDGESVPVAYALIGGVAALRIHQLGADGVWSEAWPPAPDAGLPRGVRVRLSLASGETIDRLFALQ